MGSQRGRSRSGLSGVLVDLPNLTATQIGSGGVPIGADNIAGIKFTGDAYRWSLKQEGATKRRQGRGSTVQATYRYLYTGGGGYIDIEKIEDNWPAPDQFKGQTGNVKYTILEQATRIDPVTGVHYGDRTITVPIMVTGYDPSFDVNRKDAVGARLAYVTTGAAVFAGWPGTQPSATDPTKSDLQTWDGTVFTIDPKSLQSAAQVTIDFWGANIATDAALAARLAAALAAAVPPFAGMKLRPGSITQDSPDGGTIVLHWGLTDTKDDIENQSHTARDPVGLFDDATLYVVQDSSGFAPPAAPVGKLISQDVQKRNDGKWVGVYGYGSLDNLDKLKFPESPIGRDATTLGDTDSIVVVTTTSTQPATPTPRIADLQLVRVRSIRVGGTPEEWQHLFSFARNTSVNQIEIAGTNTTIDTDDIGDSATIRQVTNSVTPPSTPSAPTGVFLRRATEPLVVSNGAFSGFWQHTFFYGPTTALQSIKFEGERTVDPATANDQEVTTNVTSSSTVVLTSPNNTDLKLVRSTSTRIQGTPEKWKHQGFYGRNNAEDEIEIERTRRRIDPDNFEESSSIAVLNGSATPPAAPAAPAGQLVGTEIEPLKVANGAFTGLWRITYLYGPTTRKQEIEQEGLIDDDQQSIDGQDVQTLTAATSTPPGTPSARISGQVLVRITSRKIQNTPEKWRHAFTFGWKTNKDAAEFESTTSTYDPIGVYTNQTGTVIANTGTAAAMAAAIHAANLSDPTYRGVTVRAMNRQKALQVIRTSGEDRKLHSSAGYVVRDSLRGIPVGSFGNTAALVKVLVLDTASGGLGHLNIVPTFVDRARGRFSYRRIRIVADPSVYFYNNLRKTVNNTTFLGWPTYNVRFCHAALLYSYAVGGAHLAIYDYQFETDDRMFVNDGAILIGGFRNFASSPLTTSGMYAATIFDATSLLSWPDTADFSVFITP